MPLPNIESSLEYHEGIQAFVDGLPSAANPYRRATKGPRGAVRGQMAFSASRYAWFRGWLAAKYSPRTRSPDLVECMGR
jgi:hypothetical protein